MIVTDLVNQYSYDQLLLWDLVPSLTINHRYLLRYHYANNLSPINAAIMGIIIESAIVTQLVSPIDHDLILERHNPGYMLDINLPTFVEMVDQCVEYLHSIMGSTRSGSPHYPCSYGTISGVVDYHQFDHVVEIKSGYPYPGHLRRTIVQGLIYCAILKCRYLTVAYPVYGYYDTYDLKGWNPYPLLHFLDHQSLA
jgi:hypothetical protein